MIDALIVEHQGSQLWLDRHGWLHEKALLVLGGIYSSTKPRGERTNSDLYDWESATHLQRWDM